MTAVIERPSPAAQTIVERSLSPERPLQPPVSENPSLKLMNTRLWMRQLSEKYGERITLGNIPDYELDELAKRHDTVWCMGIYKESEASKAHAEKWSHEYSDAISGFNKDEDVIASPFAVVGDELNPKIAKDWDEWDHFRERLHARGVRVGLDFIPNHVAIDHPWTKTNPDYFWRGSEEDLTRYGLQFFKSGENVYAHGKDPNQMEWHDTAQLNYTNPALQEAQIERFRFLSKHADIVRCDVAMLVNKDTFIRTWGWRMWPGDHEALMQMGEFWERAIGAAKADAQIDGRTVEFMAEAYWDEELLGKHFDYIYDKTMYDRMHEVTGGRMHTQELLDHMEYLYRKDAPFKPVVFTENHDEFREEEIFGIGGAKAATIVAALTPGMYLHHHGQENGGVFKPPMTTDKLPDPEFRPDKVELLDRVMTIRDSELAKRGNHWLHYAKNPHDPHGSNAEMVAQQIHHENRGVIVCTNLKSGEVEGNIFIPPGADIRVVDMITGEDIQNHGFIPDHNGAVIKLAGHGSKAIFYEYPLISQN